MQRVLARNTRERESGKVPKMLAKHIERQNQRLTGKEMDRDRERTRDRDIKWKNDKEREKWIATEQWQAQ